MKGETKMAMINRPPIKMIGYTDNEGGYPRTFIVGRDCSAILEVEEPGEYAIIPWVEVWQGEKLLARFNQNKLDEIHY
jgi:hypothetical protein